MSELRRRAAGEVAVPDEKAQMNRALQAMEAQFALAMPKGADAAQLVRDAMTVVSQTPGLLSCDRTTFLGGLMTIAQLGLRPGVLGHAWLIPFKGKAQLVIGYKGLVALAQRSGLIASIQARTVREGDEFSYAYGLSPRLDHVPGTTRGKPVAYYATVTTTTGGTYFDVMSVADMEAHRDQFAMARKDGRVVGPWAQNFDAMAEKTVLKRALRLAPMDTELARAVIVDETVRMDLSNTPPEDVSWRASAVAEDISDPWVVRGE